MRRFSANITSSAGGTTYSMPFVVDTYLNPCNIGIGITSTGSALYTVQHTFADPFAVNLQTPTTATWFNSSDSAVVSASGNKNTNYAFPPSAIRLALHDAASATATLTIIQSGVCD